MDKLTRAKLYRFVANDNNGRYLQMILENYKTVSQVFADSANLVEVIEEHYLLSENFSDKKYAHFKSFLSENVWLVKDEMFSLYIRNEFENIKNPTDVNSFNKAFKQMIDIISKYQNKIINDNLIPLNEASLNDSKNINTNNEPIPQTFLSYAYDDKGISLGLFLYFLINGGFLYVDWMWNNKLLGIEIKNKMYEQLKKSKYLLFLRTPNSELPYKYGRKMIREWCAWEIGCFFDPKLSNRKFYTSFYSNAKAESELLSDFKILLSVEKGDIIGCDPAPSI